MKKTKRIMAAMMAAAMLPAGSMTASAADSGLWEKFLKYDLCITDYTALTPEQKELCHFIFDTEQNSERMLRCERARRILAGEDVGERITTEQLDDAYGVWDKYGSSYGWQNYIHCVPDVIYTDRFVLGQTNSDFSAMAEYWLEDSGNTYVVFEDSETPDNKAFAIYDRTKQGEEGYEPAAVAAKAMTSPGQAENKEEYGFIEKNGGWYYILPDGTASFAGCTDTTATEPITESFVIESEVNGAPVTAIEQDAFAGTAYTSITLPETIKVIGLRAFSNCKYLSEINFPEGLISIGSEAFVNCESLTEVRLDCPGLIDTDGAFGRCKGLKKVYVNIPEIDNVMFDNCENIEEVEIGDRVTTIGHSAFRSVTSLSSLELPDSVRIIGSDSFALIEAEITINPSVEIIGTLKASHDVITGDIDTPAYNNLTDAEICTFSSACKIRGYRGTEAERYAEKWNCEFIPIETETGDVNLDGQVSVADAVTLQRHLLGRYVSTGAAYGDMNGDSSVDTFDMVSMRNKIVSE